MSKQKIKTCIYTEEQYDIIFNSLLSGTVEDWERLAKQFPDFPDGLDCFRHVDDDDGIFDNVGRYWIINAIDCGSLESVRWMLSKKVNLQFVDDEGHSVLHSCIDREMPDKYEMLQLLIDNGADINIGATLEAMADNSWTPLHMAAARNDLEAIKILLNNGADTTICTIIDDYATAEQEARILGNNEAAEMIRNYKHHKKQQK